MAKLKCYKLIDKKTGMLEGKFFIKSRANLVKKQLERDTKRKYTLKSC